MHWRHAVILLSGRETRSEDRRYDEIWPDLVVHHSFLSNIDSVSPAPPLYLTRISSLYKPVNKLSAWLHSGILLLLVSKKQNTSKSDWHRGCNTNFASARFLIQFLMKQQRQQWHQLEFYFIYRNLILLRFLPGNELLIKLMTKFLNWKLRYQRKKDKQYN